MKPELNAALIIAEGALAQARANRALARRKLAACELVEIDPPAALVETNDREHRQAILARRLKNAILDFDGDGSGYGSGDG